MLDRFAKYAAEGCSLRMRPNDVVIMGIVVFGMLHGSVVGQEWEKTNHKKPTPQKITADHYRIFNAKGKPASMDDLLRQMGQVQVVFLGEQHEDPVAHHLQKVLFEKHHRQCAKNASLSLEMFERDVQHVVDEYLAGLITEKHFLDSSRPWKHYARDYRPLVEYAKQHQLAVIAANAPRRYVNMVGRLGAASLRKIPNPSSRGLPPLPYAKASAKYKTRFEEVMKQHSKPAKKSKTNNSDRKKDKKPGKRKFDMKKALQAQSLWDATMAYSITEHLVRYPDSRIVHLNGRFHTANRLGVCEHLLRYRPGTTFLVVSIYSEKMFPKFDDKKMTGQGDFVIVTDASLRKTDVEKGKKD